MILVNNIKLNIDRDPRQACTAALKLLKLPAGQVSDIWLHKTSIDARKGDVKFVHSVAVVLKDENPPQTNPKEEAHAPESEAQDGKQDEAAQAKIKAEKEQKEIDDIVALMGIND